MIYIDITTFYNNTQYSGTTYTIRIMENGVLTSLENVGRDEVRKRAFQGEYDISLYNYVSEMSEAYARAFLKLREDLFKDYDRNFAQWIINTASDYRCWRQEVIGLLPEESSFYSIICDELLDNISKAYEVPRQYLTGDMLREGGELVTITTKDETTADVWRTIMTDTPSFKPGQGNAAQIEMMELAPMFNRPQFETFIDANKQEVMYRYYHGFDVETFTLVELCDRIDGILNANKDYLTFGSDAYYFLTSTEPLNFSQALKDRVKAALHPRQPIVIDTDKLNDDELNELKKVANIGTIQILNKDDTPHIDIPMFMLNDFLPFKSVAIHEITTMVDSDGKAVARLYYQERDRNATTSHTNQSALS